jgi:transposase
MVYGAIDLHMRYSQVRIVDESGTVLRDQRIVTTGERLVKAFDAFRPVRIVLEAGTESEWVAQALEAAGHAVIIADPNYAPMYGELRRKVKTDRRGGYRPAHRRSATQRATPQLLRTRRQIVRMRSGAAALVRSLLKREGCRIGTCAAEHLPTRVAALALPAGVGAAVHPMTRMIATTTKEIAALDEQLRRRAARDPIVQGLQTVPGVGVVVALTFRAQLDRIERFAHAGQVSAAIGLVPHEDSSAERRHRGHITKAGSSELRCLLVQAAWSCWRSKTEWGIARLG